MHKQVDQLDDYITPIENIIKRVNKNDLLLLYKIADFTKTTEFLVNVAISRGKLLKVN